MENGFKDELTERLMRYTAIDSQSDELSNKSPSTCLLYTSDAADE